MKNEKISVVPALKTRMDKLGKFNELIVAGLKQLMPDKAWADVAQSADVDVVTMPADAWAWLDKAAGQMNKSRNDLVTMIMVRVYPDKGE